MKILLQVALVFGIYWVGQGIEAVLPFAFPASVISLLLLLVLRLALSPLHLFTKLPVVHGINALMGGVLGLVKGALLVFLAVWVLQKLQIFITPEIVNKTVLLKFFAQNSPMDLIARL